MDSELRSVTGNEQFDDLLRGLVSLCEMTFPGRIRSYYLGGSFSDGTAVGYDRSPGSSDVDLFVLFRGTVQQAEEIVFQRLVAACRLISPIQVDAHAYSEDDLLRQSGRDVTQTSFLNALIRVASMLIYGDDISAELPPVPFTRYVLDVIESGLFHLRIPRQWVMPLAPPLTYPDPAAEFYGYDVQPGALRGTRVLVAIAMWIATLILALETGRCAGQKSQSLRLCKEHLPNDRRIRLAAAIYDTCKGTWQYQLPVDTKDRELLRDLCRDTLALENDYLKLCRDYVLKQLQHGEIEEKRQTIRILQSVVYQDDVEVP